MTHTYTRKKTTGKHSPRGRGAALLAYKKSLEAYTSGLIKDGTAITKQMEQASQASKTGENPESAETITSPTSKKPPSKGELQNIADRWLGFTKQTLTEINVERENENARTRRIREFILDNKGDQPCEIAELPKFEAIKDKILNASERVETLGKEHENTNLTNAAVIMISRAASAEEAYNQLKPLRLRNNQKTKSLSIVNKISILSARCDETIKLTQADIDDLTTQLDEAEIEFEIRQGDIGNIAETKQELYAPFEQAADKLNRKILEAMGIPCDKKGNILLAEVVVPQAPRTLSETHTSANNTQEALTMFGTVLSELENLVEHYESVERDEAENIIFLHLNEAKQEANDKIQELAKTYAAKEQTVERLELIGSMNHDAERYFDAANSQIESMQSVIGVALS